MSASRVIPLRRATPRRQDIPLPVSVAVLTIAFTLMVLGMVKAIELVNWLAEVASK